MNVIPVAVLSLALSLIPTPGHAQDSRPAEHPTSGIGWYFGFGTNLGRVKDAGAVLVKGEAGAVLGHRFTIGYAGYGLATKRARIERPTGAADTVQFGYGGARLGYIVRPTQRLHGVVGVLVGGGEARVIGTEETEHEAHAHVFVLEPSVGVEANLGALLRAAVEVTYREVMGASLSGVGNADLRGPTVSMMLRVGRF